jgi:Domain of unknown function (DUF4942)
VKRWRPAIFVKGEGLDNLLAEVKAAKEDYEWYPTTKAMLEIVAKSIKNELIEYGQKEMTYSIMDIGAGNGNALNILCELTKNDGDKYAIEKSKVLIDSLPADIFILGTDFHEQTLIDKRVDVVFCNPPYSEYEYWMERIVSEANCAYIYMIVPQRWRENKTISTMLNRRCGIIEGADDIDVEEEVRREWRRSNGKVEVLSSSTFEDSEFRQARAKVDILKIKFQDTGWRHESLAIDPFDLWFENTFKINADPSEEIEDTKSLAQELHELVAGQNLIERLEELYREDFSKLLETYRTLEKLDYDLFKELGVDLKQVKGGLKQRVAGLKNIYWQELFNNLDTITSRLTFNSREKLLKKLTEHTSIDFTATNAYAVVVWAIKNANAYFDSQLLELYLTLADKDNIHNYKSNKRLVTDRWRYEDEKHSHFILDYRLVIDHHHAFNGYGSYDKPNGINNDAHTLLNDICTIAKNLGFDVKTTSMDFQWVPGECNRFLFSDDSLFMDVRAYLKGTIHIRCDQDFMRKLNIEAGRLNGWIKSPSEAKAETGIDNAAELFNTNFKLKSIKLISAPEDAR